MKFQQKIAFCLCEVYTARAVRKSSEWFCLFGGQKEKKVGSSAPVQWQFSLA
jgi:hypothetical protein